MEESAEIWRRIFDEGAVAYPQILLEFAAFAAAMGRMQERRAVRAVSAADARKARPCGARAADVFLAVACAEGAPRAWEAFDQAYAPRLRGLLRKRGANDVEATDFVSELTGYLCQPPGDGGARTRIGTYDGSASLFSWLAVIALRNVNHRRRASAAAPESIEAAGDVSTRRFVPAHAAIGEETARRFQAAIAAAWETLTPRERLAVLLKHRDGLRGADIARLLDVGEPRVTRLLESGLARLRDAVRRQMPDTPPGTSTPDQAVWQALADVLARHLATFDRAPHDQNESRDG